MSKAISQDLLENLLYRKQRFGYSNEVHVPGRMRSLHNTPYVSDFHGGLQPPPASWHLLSPFVPQQPPQSEKRKGDVLTFTYSIGQVVEIQMPTHTSVGGPPSGTSWVRATIQEQRGRGGNGQPDYLVVIGTPPNELVHQINQSQIRAPAPASGSRRGLSATATLTFGLDLTGKTDVTTLEYKGMMEFGPKPGTDLERVERHRVLIAALKAAGIHDDRITALAFEYHQTITGTATLTFGKNLAFITDITTLEYKSMMEFQPKPVGQTAIFGRRSQIATALKGAGISDERVTALYSEFVNNYNTADTARQRAEWLLAHPNANLHFGVHLTQGVSISNTDYETMMNAVPTPSTQHEKRARERAVESALTGIGMTTTEISSLYSDFISTTTQITSAHNYQINDAVQILVDGLPMNATVTYASGLGANGSPMYSVTYNDRATGLPVTIRVSQANMTQPGTMGAGPPVSTAPKTEQSTIEHFQQLLNRGLQPSVVSRRLSNLGYSSSFLASATTLLSNIPNNIQYDSNFFKAQVWVAKYRQQNPGKNPEQITDAFKRAVHGTPEHTVSNAVTGEWNRVAATESTFSLGGDYLAFLRQSLRDQVPGQTQPIAPGTAGFHPGGSGILTMGDHLYIGNDLVTVVATRGDHMTYVKADGTRKSVTYSDIAAGRIRQSRSGFASSSGLPQHQTNYFNTAFAIVDNVRLGWRDVFGQYMNEFNNAIRDTQGPEAAYTSLLAFLRLHPALIHDTLQYLHDLVATNSHILNNLPKDVRHALRNPQTGTGAMQINNTNGKYEIVLTNVFGNNRGVINIGVPPGAPTDDVIHQATGDDVQINTITPPGTAPGAAPPGSTAPGATTKPP